MSTAVWVNLGYTDATQTPVVIAEHAAACTNRFATVRQQVSITTHKVATNTL